MKIRFFCVTFLLLLISSKTTFAQQLNQSYNIEVEVLCIETAREIIAELNGHNLDSQASFSEWGSWASFTRRVDSWAFRHVQDVLRSLGEVQSEWENANELSMEILNLETQLAVLSQEMERLSLLMAGSESLDVLIAINDRITSVSRNRDDVIGRRNYLLSQVASPVIYIHLTEIIEDDLIEPVSFGSRVSDSFFGSLRATLQFGGNFIVFIARFGLMILIWASVVGGTAFGAYKVIRRRKQEVVENE